MLDQAHFNKKSQQCLVCTEEKYIGNDESNFNDYIKISKNCRYIEIWFNMKSNETWNFFDWPMFYIFGFGNSSLHMNQIVVFKVVTTISGVLKIFCIFV